MKKSFPQNKLCEERTRLDNEQDLRKLREVRPIGDRKSYPKSIFKDYYMVQHYIEETV